MRAKHDFLMDGVDADADRLMRARQRDGLAFPVDIAARSRMNAREQFNQRRFAGPVLTDDCVNFTSFEGEIDGLERMRGAKALIEFLQRKERSARRRRGRGAFGLQARPPSFNVRLTRRIKQVCPALSWPTKVGHDRQVSS